MAKKGSAKQGKDFFDTRSGRVHADLNFAERSSVSAKTEIGFIREAFPLRSKDDITLVLQSCDYNVDEAIACFTNGEADNLLKEWNTQGRKSKSARKKRNKKKQAKINDPETPEVAMTTQDSENVSQLKQKSLEDAPVTSKEGYKKPTHAESTTLKCAPQSVGPLHLQPPLPSSTEVSLPSSNCDQPVDSSQDTQTTLKHTPGCSSQTNHSNLKFERMISSGPDALKKTVKDLQRSSVSLPRFQLLLEEECEKSSKSISQIFQELRQCLNDREAHLLGQMTEFKKQAVELLEQRQENAAALKLKSDRVAGMPENEVTQLRSEIKNFVTERKIDEELARTTRFVADKDQLFSMIANFGAVVPIKSCYSPVTLNPPSLPKKKVERNNDDKKIAAENVSSLKPPQPPAPANTSAPVSTSSVENSVSSQKTLQEVAELHARLQAALRDQGLASPSEGHVEGQKQETLDQKNDKSNSASHTTDKQQTSQNQQRRRDQNRQPERTKQNRSAETRGAVQDRQYNNQSNRNSRGPYQRSARQRNPRSEIPNEKMERPKNIDTPVAQKTDLAQQKVEADESLKSSGSSNKVVSPQPESVKGDVHSGNRNSQPRNNQRTGRGDGPRGRDRRRGGRGGGAEGPKRNGPGEKLENGPLKNDPVDKGSFHKEVMKTVSEKEDCDLKKSTNKESGTTEETEEVKNGASLPNGPVLNGMETLTDSSNSHSSNGEHAHVLEKEGVKKEEALPQRRERPSRRRGTQRNKKDGPVSEKQLNGAKSAENGTGEDHGKEEGVADNEIQEQTENVQKEKQEIKSENQSTQELQKDIGKPGAARANGYIPLKEVNEVNIDR